MRLWKFLILPVSVIFFNCYSKHIAFASENDGYSTAFIIRDDEYQYSTNIRGIMHKILGNQLENDCEGDMYDDSSGVYSDPFISLNRGIFAFNKRVDDFFLNKFSQLYFKTTPIFLAVVDNFYSNWNQTPLLWIYSVLELDIESIFVVGWRFVLNTTFGIFGVYDIAGEFGLFKPVKSIDQMLMYYGLSRGPFLMIPIIGPSTITNSIEIPMITALNLFGPNLYGIGLPLGASVMFAWLGNNTFSYAMNYTALLGPSRILYNKAYELIVNSNKSDAIDSYPVIRDMYMSFTNNAIYKENLAMIRGRFKKEPPIQLSHNARISDSDIL